MTSGLAAEAAAADHAGCAADHLLALVETNAPGYPVTPARRDAMVTLLISIVRTLTLEHRA